MKIFKLLRLFNSFKVSTVEIFTFIHVYSGLDEIEVDSVERDNAFVEIAHHGSFTPTTEPDVQSVSNGSSTVSIPTSTTESSQTFTTNSFMKTFKKSQCLDDFSLFPAGSRRVAITSFPGSGNTWARHLLHMGTGIWTGNARSSEKLKEVGWQGEDIPCKEGRTIAIKTHKWHTVKKCAYQAAIILVRNPFHALVAEFNRQMTGKTEHLDAELFAALGNCFI